MVFPGDGAELHVSDDEAGESVCQWAVCVGAAPELLGDLPYGVGQFAVVPCGEGGAL